MDSTRREDSPLTGASSSRELPAGWWLAVVVLTLVGAFLRIAFLNDPMQYDESFTVWQYARSPISEIVSTYTYPNNHIFHTILVNLAWRAGGADPWVVRIPALLAGVATIPVGALTFARLGGWKTGILTAAVIAGSSPLIDFSAQARGYSIIGLLALICVRLAFEIRRQTSSLRTVAILGIVGAVGLWTVPIFVIPFAVSLAWVLTGEEVSLGRRASRAAASGGIALLGAAILYIPVIFSEGLGAITDNRFVSREPWREFLGEMPEFAMSAVKLWIHNLPLALAVILLLGLLLALIRGSREIRTLAIAVLVVVPVILIFQRATPPPRVLLPIWPLLLGISISGLLSFKRLRSLAIEPALIVSGLLLLALANTTPDQTGLLTPPEFGDHFPDAEAIALELDDRVNPGAFVATSGTPHLHYYMLLHGISDDPLIPPWNGRGDLFAVTMADQTVDYVLEVHLLKPAGDAAVLLSSYDSGELWSVPLDTQR